MHLISGRSGSWVCSSRVAAVSEYTRHDSTDTEPTERTIRQRMQLRCTRREEGMHLVGSRRTVLTDWEMQ